ncbi:hypothetical protein F4804DRAFT_323660 [Jackrogersella minutella]|nr:hypothetical protein F4804DRAFT_323660 [Jackrogersella minutella]
MSTSRVFTPTLRTVVRRSARAFANRQTILRSGARRGYASNKPGSAGAEKTNDMPWLIGSVALTVPALAWLLSGSPKQADAHDDPHTPGGEPEPGSDSPGADTPDSEPPTGDSNPQAAQSSSGTGQNVPPAAADSSDLATDYAGKKAAHEEYKDVVRRKDTRVATSSSDMPSKKTAAEHPREDPLKGEGEGARKGGPG